MTSKTEPAKIIQRYIAKTIPVTCSTCCHLNFDLVKWGKGLTIFEDKHIRCGIGGFAVKKMGTCRLHDFKKLSD